MPGRPGLPRQKEIARWPRGQPGECVRAQPAGQTLDSRPRAAGVVAGVEVHDAVVDGGPNERHAASFGRCQSDLIVVSWFGRHLLDGAPFGAIGRGAQVDHIRVVAIGDPRYPDAPAGPHGHCRVVVIAAFAREKLHRGHALDPDPAVEQLEGFLIPNRSSAKFGVTLPGLDDDAGLLGTGDVDDHALPAREWKCGFVLGHHLQVAVPLIAALPTAVVVGFARTEVMRSDNFGGARFGGYAAAPVGDGFVGPAEKDAEAVLGAAELSAEQS